MAAITFPLFFHTCLVSLATWSVQHLPEREERYINILEILLWNIYNRDKLPNGSRMKKNITIKYRHIFKNKHCILKTWSFFIYGPITYKYSSSYFINLIYHIPQNFIKFSPSINSRNQNSFVNTAGGGGGAGAIVQGANKDTRGRRMYVCTYSGDATRNEQEREPRCW